MHMNNVCESRSENLCRSRDLNSYHSQITDSTPLNMVCVCGINQSALADRRSRHLVMTKYKKRNRPPADHWTIGPLDHWTTGPLDRPSKCIGKQKGKGIWHFTLLQPKGSQSTAQSAPIDLNNLSLILPDFHCCTYIWIFWETVHFAL